MVVFIAYHDNVSGLSSCCTCSDNGKCMLFNLVEVVVTSIMPLKRGHCSYCGRADEASDESVNYNNIWFQWICPSVMWRPLQLLLARMMIL